MAGGYKAIDSLRLEKGYRVWGADITPEDTPFEAVSASRSSSTRATSSDGRRSRRRRDPERRLRCLTLADPRAVALGSEPVRVAATLAAA